MRLRKSARKRRKHKGGNLPARYFDPYANDMAAADAGYDRLGASNGVIRPAIGGKASTTRRSKRSKRSKKMKGGFTQFAAKGGFTQFAAKGGFTQFAAKGGFIPSIMEPFIIGCSKFIYPIVGYSAYKLMNRSTRHKKR